uniref:Uncharacterized protein n=1 Tax=Tanacetum cinerariifolium TaxID=118510 RepID=A0A699HZP9_TANCI|nr:hypothetical protein [Tanacetum cinerariifolium]
MTKLKDNDKGSRSKIVKHEGTSLQRRQRQRQELNDKSSLNELTKECHNELTSGEIVRFEILSRTRNGNNFSDETNKRNLKEHKPKTMSQQRKTMCTYMKNMARYKMEHFKGKSFYEVKEIFDKVYKQVTSFVPMESYMEKERTKRAGLNLQEESSKRQKTEEGSESTEEPKDDEISQEDLQQMMMVVPVEEVYVEALQAKYPIIDWERFDRDDLVRLCDLVKERFSTTEPADDKEKALWVELKRLYEPNNDDILWKLQRKRT